MHFVGTLRGLNTDLADNMLVVTNYHYIRPSFDNPYPGIHGETPEQFENQLSQLGQFGDFVTIGQVRDAVLKRRPLPEKAVLVTFDDGLREQYDYAWPILKRMEIPAAFFINTAPIKEGRVSIVHKIHLLRSQVEPSRFVDLLRKASVACDTPISFEVDAASACAHYQFDSEESARLKYLLNFTLHRKDRDALIEWCFAQVYPNQEKGISAGLYMDAEQIAVLGEHRSVGTHAHEHVPLGLLKRNQIKWQLEKSLDSLEEMAGYRPFALSYPYGSREASSLEAGQVAQELGIQIGFTIERAANAGLNMPLHLARFNCNNLPGGKSATFTPTSMFSEAPARVWFHTLPTA